MAGYRWSFGILQSTDTPMLRLTAYRSEDSMKRVPVRVRRSSPSATRRANPPPPSRVRIVVADQHTIDRGGLVGLLNHEPDLEVVGEAATVAEAIEECRALAPDVLLLSLSLSGQEPGPAIPRIRAELPELRI